MPSNHNNQSSDQKQAIDIDHQERNSNSQIEHGQIFIPEEANMEADRVARTRQANQDELHRIRSSLAGSNHSATAVNIGQHFSQRAAAQESKISAAEDRRFEWEEQRTGAFTIQRDSALTCSNEDGTGTSAPGPRGIREADPQFDPDGYYNHDIVNPSGNHCHIDRNREAICRTNPECNPQTGWRFDNYYHKNVWMVAPLTMMTLLNLSSDMVDNRSSMSMKDLKKDTPMMKVDPSLDVMNTDTNCKNHSSFPSSQHIPSFSHSTPQTSISTNQSHLTNTPSHQLNPHAQPFTPIQSPRPNPSITKSTPLNPHAKPFTPSTCLADHCEIITSAVSLSPNQSQYDFHDR